MNRITIVGVGARRGELTLDAVEALRSGEVIALRTERCECAEWLGAQGISYLALDRLYDEAGDFDQLNRAIAHEVLRLAEENPVVYAVPDVRDQAALALLQDANADARVIPGVPLDAHLSAYAQSPCLTLSASDHELMLPESAQAVLAREIDTRELAGELKLRLMERYPEETQVRLSLEDGTSMRVPLCGLDRLKDSAYGHRMSAYIGPEPELTRLERYGFGQLNQIMRVLRGPGGCPWDIKQTHQSLTANVVEEAYEVVDAIDRGDMDALYDELGDLLLQVTLHSEIARQHGEFTIDDVLSAVCKKLISRHEHIFGTAQADTPDQVLALWERAKRKEKQLSTVSESMRAITRSLPQLMRALKVHKKAAQAGFDCELAEQALSKVYEEADELSAAIQSGRGIEEELGDLLFACAHVARHLKLEPELALAQATDKFIRRFEAMENRILGDGKRMEALNLQEMDRYWDQIKQEIVKP